MFRCIGDVTRRKLEIIDKFLRFSAPKGKKPSKGVSVTPKMEFRSRYEKKYLYFSKDFVFCTESSKLINFKFAVGVDRNTAQVYFIP